VSDIAGLVASAMTVLEGAKKVEVAKGANA